MPSLDSTGPRGQGLMTGRGMGPCGQGAFYSRGRGSGFGMGFGRGCGCRFNAMPITASEEEKMLKEDREILKEELSLVEKQLKDIKSSK